MVIGEEYEETIKEWKTPTNTKEVEQFLGFVNYHRNFIKGYSAIAKPFSILTGKKQFKWGTEQQEAYKTHKKALQSTPVLTLPFQLTSLFWIQTPRILKSALRSCKYKTEMKELLPMGVLHCLQLNADTVPLAKNCWPLCASLNISDIISLVGFS